jgi:hypothetical protein
MDKRKGIEKIVWVLDFKGIQYVPQKCFSLCPLDYGQRAKSPEGRQVSKNSLHVLQNYYPERLGAAFIIGAPWYFSMLYTVRLCYLSVPSLSCLHLSTFSLCVCVCVCVSLSLSLWLHCQRVNAPHISSDSSLLR